MAAITLEELLKEVGVRPEKLNDSISDDHLHEIVLFLTSWQTVASKLCLSEIDQDAIEREGKNEEDKKRKVFQKWKGKFAFKATYRKLVEALLSLSMADVAEKVCRLLPKETAELKNLRDLQASLKEKLSDTETETVELAKEAPKHEQDTKLHHKQFLSEMKQNLAQNIKKCQFLEKIFDEQNAEIERLREELQTKEHQLQSLQQETLAMQKRLHEDIERLQKEKEKLIMSCEAEKEEASRQRRHVSALEKELKEAEMQKQQAHLEKEAAIQELEAKKIEMQLRPKVTDHPKSLKDAVPGNPVMFNIQATGSEPLSYQWQRKTGGGSEGWQSCDVKRFPGANSSTLIIPSVQNSNEGSYRCIVSNCAGSETSEFAILTVAKPPRITGHPQELKDAVSGKLCKFSVQVVGTEPLNYMWQHKIESGSDEWQSCDVESFPGANSPTLIIPSVQRSNEGSYRCTVSNCVGGETSECARLIVVEPPRITAHPQEVKGAIPGKVATFRIEATGTQPLKYQWEHEAGDGHGEWQSCDAERFPGTTSSTLTIPILQTSDGGNYHCTVSNCAGSETSEYATLTLAEPPRITACPQQVKNAIPGKSVTFSVEATGTEPLNYQWQQKTGDWSGGWQSCDVERFPGANSSTLTIPSVQKSNEGSYRCIVSNCAGSETSEFATLTVAEPPRITTHPKDLRDAVPGKPVTFTVQATGTEPLSYRWQWMEGNRREEWQLCDVENFLGVNSTKLAIFRTTMWAYYKGSYRCTISNCAGSQTSDAATFTFDTYQQLSKQLPSSFPAKPAQPVVKAFVVGDPGAGKSTLTKALQTENRGLSYIANRVLKVTGVDQKTAGIVPHDVESKKFGRLTLYDFAGQKEFYASHDAVLRSAVSQPTAAVFLIVVNLCASDKEFTERIQYWLAFLENQRVSAVAKPHLIIIASHADQLKAKAEVEGKRRIVESLQQSPAFSDFHYAGFVSMDCRYSRSSSMSHLRQYLAKSCEEIRSTVEMSDRSQFFLVYLQSKFGDCPAVQLSQVSAAIANESEEDPMFGPLVACIPYEIRSDLSQVCDELNGRGNILFLKSSLSSESSWIILNCEALLSQVTGTIFAPEDFRQHQDLATSTGVVPFTRIVRLLPLDLDPNMIVDFLCHFEFCHMIADKDLSVLLQNQFSEADAISFDGSTDKYYFFPGLVSVEVPSGVWEEGPMCDYHCGWVLQCNRSGQFFTPRFVQVLLLRLAFSFTELAPKVSDSLPSFQRRCSLWKSGICWENKHGVETLVEVGEGSRRVVVMWRCLKNREVECANQRSDVIRKVLQAREEFCPKVTLSEFYLQPSDSKEYPPKPSSELALINTVEVASAIAEAKLSVKDSNGNDIALTELLGFEPYAFLGQHIIEEIFDEHKTQEHISDEFLHGIADKNYHEFEHFKKMLEISTASVDSPAAQASSGEMARLLLSWREKSEGSRQCLHQKLNQFSVFAGRNPLDLQNSQVSTTSVL